MGRRSSRTLSGEIDLSNADQLSRVLMDATGNWALMLVLDLAERLPGLGRDPADLPVA